MVQLNRSMMERYEIADRRPQKLRAALFGADRIMLGAAARLLDMANEQGANLGAVVFTRAADALNKQDGMFTLLVRGDLENGGCTREERVVQSVIMAVDPEAEFEAFLSHAKQDTLDMIFISEGCDAVKIALAARFLHARMEAGLNPPCVMLMGEHFCGDEAADLKSAVAALARGWARSEEFARWLQGASFMPVLAETLSGRLSDGERAKAQHDMNYRDDFIAWAEPRIKCTAGGEVPEDVRQLLAGDFETACAKKARVFDAIVFLSTAAGWLSGMDSFAQTLKDERLRAWIGGAFFDEILPALPWKKEEIAPEIISAFSRLENSMNDMPLTEIGRGLMGAFKNGCLSAVRAWADREFESPKRLSLALSAAIMMYAGARRNEKGAYEIQRGDRSHVIYDAPEVLEGFSSMAHDMPAETLTYAVLADRALWGCDLREIDGLEMRVMFNISSIQRIGFRETLRLQEE